MATLYQKEHTKQRQYLTNVVRWIATLLGMATTREMYNNLPGELKAGGNLVLWDIYDEIMLQGHAKKG